MFNSGMANGSGDQYDPRNNKTGAPVDYVMQPEEDENGESDKELWMAYRFSIAHK